MRSGVRQPRLLSVLLVILAALSGCVSTGKTEPLPPEATRMAGATRLAVIGDYGTRDAGEQAIADAINKDEAANGLDALVTVGDNVYPSGAPKDFAAAWTKPYGWVQQARIPVLAALGNHDDNSGPAALTDLMRMLQMPGRWYERQVGNVQLIVLDGNDVKNPGQLKFLQSVLAAPRPAGADWRVVTFHQAAFSCSRHQSTPVVQREWVPLFARSGVDLVLNGHDHAYQRFDPIAGVTYVVTGAGGSQLYEMGTCPAGTPTPTVAEVRSDYVVLETTGSSLRLQGITADGRVFDSWTIRR